MSEMWKKYIYIHKLIWYFICIVIKFLMKILLFLVF